MKRVCNVVCSFFLLICICFGGTSCINNPQHVRAELVGQWTAEVKCQIDEDTSLTKRVAINFDFEGGYELSIFTYDAYHLLTNRINVKGTYSIWQNTIKLKPNEKNDYAKKDGYTEQLSYVYNKYTGELSLYYLGQPCK